MKATTCQQCREWIEREAFEDLTNAEQENLRTHLAECPDCRAEREILESTLAELRSFPEAPAPRHFYVYDATRRRTPWALFGQLSPLWRVATAGVLVAVLAVGAAAATRLQVQTEEGVLKLAFGEIQAQPKIDPVQLRAELLRQVDSRIEDSRRQWTEAVLDQMTESIDALSDQQRQRLRQVAAQLEDRLEARQKEARLQTEADLREAALQIYKTLSRNQQRQVALLNDRLDLLTVNGQIQGSQTEALMATVLQIADLKGLGQ